MIRVILIFLLVFIPQFFLGQEYDTEIWRTLGYEAKLKGDYSTSLFYYLKIAEADSNDYDARLAIARLYILNGNYQKAISGFQNILKSDSTDVEAMNGLGQCHSHLGNEKESINYFKLALTYLPDDHRQYFFLADAYLQAGQLDKAMSVYQQINQIDSTYAETWSGMGKISLWQGKPKTALKYYEHAFFLDPQNKEIEIMLNKTREELDFVLKFQTGPLQEKEADYTIKAINTKVKIEKRVNDHFQAEINALLDYSNRDFIDNIDDTTRWYNSTWVKAGWISEHHKVSLQAGYSNTDNTFSTYGIDWKMNYPAGNFLFKNTFSSGYDYYYYWNEVGAYYITDIAQIGYKKISFNAMLTYGLTDTVFVADYYWPDSSEVKENPFQSYSFSLTYRFFKNPALSFSLLHSYLNYNYKSPLYYSPMDRRLSGVSATAYYELSRFYFYAGFAYNIGSEYYYEWTDYNAQKVKMNVNNWSVNIEIGYTNYPYAIALNANNFYNPYYQSLSAFLNFKYSF